MKFTLKTDFDHPSGYTWYFKKMNENICINFFYFSQK